MRLSSAVVAGRRSNRKVRVFDADAPVAEEGAPSMRPIRPTLLYVGIVLVAAGFALIAFSWGQVAGLESVPLQLPYLLSGGLTGLGLIIVGATAVNIHAKRREAAERERQTQQLMEILRQVTSVLEGGSPQDARPEGAGRVGAPDDPAQADGYDLTEEMPL